VFLWSCAPSTQGYACHSHVIWYHLVCRGTYHGNVSIEA
jgi:hypothetical protein